MGSEDGDVYIMQEGEEGDWVNPTSARTLILETLEADGEVDPEDVELDDYVDWEELQAVLDGEADDLTVEIEDVTVTVDGDGNVEVD